MDNLRGLLGIRRMDRIPNARIRELCGVMMRVNEKIDDSVLRWFGHVESRENDRFAKRIYVGECAGNHSVSRPRKRWVDTVKDYLRKRGLYIWQTRRMVHDRSEWQCL